MKYRNMFLHYFGAPRPFSTESRSQVKEARRSPRLIKLDGALEEVVERVLCDYNKEHGTELEFVGLLAKKHENYYGFGYFSDFIYTVGLWKHFNFMARDAADPRKPFVLFAELLWLNTAEYLLTMLSIVKPSDECKTCYSHPRHGFRAGLIRDHKILSEPKTLSEQAATELSEFALQGYNKKHGTRIKFVRALKCNSFTCCGLRMDFNEKKNTNWVHMNFEVRVDESERVVCLFGEMYLGDDGKYVLATLSPAAPTLEPPAALRGVAQHIKFYTRVAMQSDAGERRKEYTGVNGCVFCPPDILHPWRVYRFAFNDYWNGIVE